MPFILRKTITETFLGRVQATPHLKAFGAIEIPRADYLRRLNRCLKEVCEFPLE